MEPKPATPPVLWSKPVNSKLSRVNGRFRVVLAGQEDLDEAGALCIKVGGWVGEWVGGWGGWVGGWESGYGGGGGVGGRVGGGMGGWVGE